ncbi:MAG TPA: serine hydrolase [Pyrinomonadaceae bacterium]|jgi:hypothetical protein|nr:serine hydrolase [Pyrinomonadaceae bacterium]
MSTGDDSQIRQALAKFENLPGKEGKTWNTTYSIESFEPGVPPVISYYLRNTDSLFCASAFKVFVLAAYLYYAERGQLPNQPSQAGYPSPLAAALDEPLTIDASDLTQSSKVFGYEFPGYPTGVTGTTSASAILAAMIAYSDNTATDLALKRVGVENVRAFMYDTVRDRDKPYITKDKVAIPDSTRAFYNYLNPNPPSPDKRHLLNDTETMKCTALAFAKFYWQTLDWPNNPYFKTEETRRHFKSFLSMSQAIPQGIPEETLCYMKGGMANYDGQVGQKDYIAEHAMAGAGQVTVPYKPDGALNVQFALLYNWNDLNGVDNWQTGVQAFIQSFKEVFTAIRVYVWQQTQ